MDALFRCGFEEGAWALRGDLDRRHASRVRKRDPEQDNGVKGEMSVGGDLCANPLSEHRMAKEKDGAGGLWTSNV